MVSRMSAEHTGPDSMWPSFFYMWLPPKPQETAKHLLWGADAPKDGKPKSEKQSD